MAERPFAQSFDLDSEEWSGDSDSETDSDYELARQDISEAVPLIKSEGATQIDQGHAIATHRKLIKGDNRQIINVNVTANIYLHDGLPALTAEQHKELASNNNASGHTNNLNLDLGQYGSVQISLPVSSPAKATSKCSCMLSEVQSQDIQNLPDAVRRASSEKKLLKYSDVSQSVSELQAEGDSSKKTGNSNSKSRTSDNQPSGVNTTGAWICTREGVIYPPQIDGSEKAVLTAAGRYLASKLGSYFMKRK